MGIVPAQDAFSGFSDDIVIIVASALVVSAAVSRSGIMEVLLQRLAPNIATPRLQLILLVAVVAVLSAFVKNIGALAIMMPIAFQMARRSGVSPSMFLMPMSFAALLGGLMTQIGTSPNIIVSSVREELTGTSFTMFDLPRWALALTFAGVIFLALFYWLLPVRARTGWPSTRPSRSRTTPPTPSVESGSSVIGRTVGDLQKLAEGGAMVLAITSVEGKQRKPLPDACCAKATRLILEGTPEGLDTMVERGWSLELSASARTRVRTISPPSRRSSGPIPPDRHHRPGI